jgi:hypothetical protein
VKDTEEEEGMEREGRREGGKEGEMNQTVVSIKGTMACTALNVGERERIAFHQRVGTWVKSP